MSTPTCTCHGEPMAGNGRTPTGRQLWRCRVALRDRVAAFRVENPRVPCPRPVMSDDERENALRYRQAQHSFNRRARRHAELYAERAEIGGTDGDELIPLRYLWHPVDRLVELLTDSFGTDLPAVLRAERLDYVFEATARRQYVNLAKCDRMLTRLGLHIDRLGKPLFSVGPPANPQRREQRETAAA